MRGIGLAVMARLLVELLVDADAHAKDERQGLPLLRETALVCPSEQYGVPVLVLL